MLVINKVGSSKTLLKKSFKFVPNRENNIVMFNLSFLLLSVKFNTILEKKSHQKDVIVACGIGHINIILALLIEIIALYIQAFIVQIRVAVHKKSISGCGIC